MDFLPVTGPLRISAWEQSPWWILKGTVVVCSFCLLRGTEFFQTHHPLVVRRACCFVYRVFTMSPRYTSQQDFVIRHCWLLALLLPHKDLKRIAQTLRETGVRALSLRLTVALIPFYRSCSWCTEQGSNLPKVKCRTVGRGRHWTKNTSTPGPTLITGTPFLTSRARWMPRTDWDKFLLMDCSGGRHLAVEICHYATADRLGAMSCFLAYL